MDIGLNLGCGNVYFQDDDLKIVNIDNNENHTFSGFDHELTKRITTSYDYFSKNPNDRIREKVIVDKIGNITNKSEIENIIDGRKVKRIYALQVLEHFPLSEVSEIFSLWTDLLEKGGEMIISVPDILNASKIITEHPANSVKDNQVRASMYRLIHGGQRDLNDYHKCAFDYHRIYYLFKTHGFINVLQKDNFYWHPAVVMSGVKG